MNQIGWNPPILQFIRVKILLKMVAGFFFLKHRCHILHFPNSTGLFTKPTDRHYTKYRFSPDIALHSRFTMSWQPKLLDFERMCIFCKKSLPQIWALMSAQNSLATKHNLQILSTLAFAGLQQSGSRGDSIDRQRIGMRLLQRLPMGFRLKMHTCHLLLDLLVDLLRHSVGHLSRRPLPMGGSCQHGRRSSGADLWSGRTGDVHLVADEPVEVQDCRKITDHFRGIHRTYPTLIMENRRMSACNRLDLQNTRISTDYAQKPPRSLEQIHCDGRRMVVLFRMPSLVLHHICRTLLMELP